MKKFLFLFTYFSFHSLEIFCLHGIFYLYEEMLYFALPTTKKYTQKKLQHFHFASLDTLCINKIRTRDIPFSKKKRRRKCFWREILSVFSVNSVFSICSANLQLSWSWSSSIPSLQQSCLYFVNFSPFSSHFSCKKRKKGNIRRSSSVGMSEEEKLNTSHSLCLFSCNSACFTFFYVCIHYTCFK